MFIVNGKLDYYQKNTTEAFNQGYVAMLHKEIIGGELYSVRKYYLPCHLAKKIRWLKKYFIHLDDNGTDTKHKRHKNWCEFSETAIIVLNRINNYIQHDRFIIAGSQYVCPLPWAIFGIPEKSKMAQNYFEQLTEIGDHYKNCLHGKCYPIDIHFRLAPELPVKMARKFNRRPYNSPNYWMAVALALAYDIIHFCGPDVNEFIELFTNDTRENSSNVNIPKWQSLRCRMLGINRKPDLKSLKYPPVRVIEEEVIPKRVKTEIEEIESGDLAFGAKTSLVFEKKYLPVPYRPSGTGRQKGLRKDLLRDIENFANLDEFEENIKYGIPWDESRFGFVCRGGVGGSPNMI